MSLIGRLLKRAFTRLRGTGNVGDGAGASFGGNLAALLQQAQELASTQHFGDAQTLFRKVLDRDPQNLEALLWLGISAARERRYGIARDLLERLVRVDPGCLDGFNALANVARLERRWQDARAFYGKALELDPDAVAVLANLGTCLREMDQPAEAQAHLKRALEIEPDNTDALFGFATVLIDAGEIERAESCLRRVLALEPRMADAHMALGHLLLLRGAFEEGWREYDWRHCAEVVEQEPVYPYPYWHGDPIEGEVILVRAEQGLGDQIMFASCLPDLQCRARGVILECDPRLAPIFARSFPSISVHPRRANDPEGWRAAGINPDKQVFFGSLPRYFRNHWEEFPTRGAYLQADPIRVAQWRERLDDLGAALKIGFSWRGGTPQTRQALRSIPLSEWRPLFNSRGCRWISLQYGAAAAEVLALAEAHELPLHHWQQAIDDHEETVALMTALDLVVSVPTAAVHLAGALGRPAWVMVPFAPEWRYLARGECLPWYSSVTVLRQQRPGDWGPVLADVSARLAVLERRSR